jgi:hypothetical protein
VLTAVAAGLVALLLPMAAGATKPVPFQPGVTLAGFSPNGYPKRDVTARLKEIRDDYGARSVTLIVVWAQDNLHSTDIHPGYETVRTKQLTAAIHTAHKLGLKVTLRPYIDPLQGGWRGFIDPNSVTKWFADYKRFILRYAKLAQENRVNGFVAGTELLDLEKYTSKWQNVIRAVRGVYKRGFVTYQANWDSYQNVGFWHSLDAIDISGYFPLTTSNTYTVDDLVAGWQHYVDPYNQPRDWFAEIEAFHNQIGLPVFFGEVGYRSVVGSARRPWDVDYQAPHSDQAQNVAYEAAFRTWYHVPWFEGFFWWFEPSESIGTHRGFDHEPSALTRATVKSWYTTPR